jgi:hypothetical protein
MSPFQLKQPENNVTDTVLDEMFGEGLAAPVAVLVRGPEHTHRNKPKPGEDKVGIDFWHLVFLSRGVVFPKSAVVRNWRYSCTTVRTELENLSPKPEISQLIVR